MPFLPWLALLVLLLGAGCKVKPEAGPGLEPPSPIDGAMGGRGATPGGSGGSSGGVGAPVSGAAGSGSVVVPPTGTGGTGGTPGEVVDSDGGVETFSLQHADEIAKDCTESVACLEMRDEPLEEDPFAECLRDTAAVLDTGGSDVRMRFLVNVERCRESSACEYYDCAIAGS